MNRTQPEIVEGENFWEEKSKVAVSRLNVATECVGSLFCEAVETFPLAAGCLCTIIAISG